MLEEITQIYKYIQTRYLEITFSHDRVYFSDDLAILPGDGQVLPIGDARSYWSHFSEYTSSEGFRPLYIHREELKDEATLKIKLSNFIKMQKADLQAPKISDISKQNIYNTLDRISHNSYSQSIITYLANRKDFVIVAHPDNTIIPALKEGPASGRADYGWNMISIAGSTHYDLFGGPLFFLI